MKKLINQMNRPILLCILSFLLVFASAGVFPGCSTAPQVKAHLKLAALPYLGFTPIYIAEDQGYFAEQGLEIEYVNFNSLTQAVPLLAQGNLDIGAGSINASLINGIAQGANLKIVASREYFQPGGDDGALMARQDIYKNGELNTLAKIKGRQIAIPCLACINELELAKILEKGGLTPADVKTVRMNNEDMIPALQNKAIDAVLVGDPFNDEFSSMGLATTIESINKAMPDFQYGVIVFGPNLLEKNPDLGKKFMTAYFKGVTKFMEGKTKYNAGIVKKYLKLDDKAIEDLTWNPVSKDGHIKLEDISSFQDWAFSRKYIDKKVDVKDMVDTRFIN